MTGGVETIVGEHARLLRAAGRRVLLIAGRGDAEVVPELDSRNPRVEAVTGSLAGGEVPADFDGLRTDIARALRPLLEAVDVVIAHNVLTMPFNLPLAAALVDSGRRLVAWTHDLGWNDDRYRDFRRDGEPYAMLRRAQPGVKYVAISGVIQADTARLLELPPDEVRVVPNGIDAWTFLGVGAAVTDLARRAGLDRAGPIVLLPARITPRKRIDLALRAIAPLKERYPGIRLVVSGPLGAHSLDNAAHFRSLVELRASLGLEGTAVFFHEFSHEGVHPVSPEMLPELFQLADVVLLPSASEGFGLPVLEAALARLPMVCADLPVLHEAGGEELYTFPRDSGPEAVTAALEAALARPSVRAAVRVRERYDWRSVLGLLEQVIDEAAARD